MANKSAQKPERPEREPIERGFVADAARRGIDTLHWGRRLASVSSALLWASCAFSVATLAGVALKRPPEVYASSIDGRLTPLPIARDPRDLGALFEAIRASDKQQRELARGASPKAGAKAALPAAAPAAEEPAAKAESPAPASAPEGAAAAPAPKAEAPAAQEAGLGAQPAAAPAAEAR